MAYRFTAAATGLIPSAVKTAIEAAGSKLATIEQATVTDIPTKIDNIEVATDAPSVAEIRAEMDANSTKLAAINLATTDTIPTAIAGVTATVDETALATAIASELGDVGGASVSDIVSALVGKNITVTSPVTADQDVEVYAADDYIDAWDRSLSWSNSGGDWAGGDLTDAVVTMAIVDASGNAVLTKTGSVVTATGTQSVMVELEEADVSLLTQEGKRYKYQLYITKSGYRQTLATGSVTAVQPAAEVVEE